MSTEPSLYDQIHWIVLQLEERKISVGTTWIERDLFEQYSTANALVARVYRGETDFMDLVREDFVQGERHPAPLLEQVLGRSPPTGTRYLSLLGAGASLASVSSFTAASTGLGMYVPAILGVIGGMTALSTFVVPRPRDFMIARAEFLNWRLLHGSQY